MTIDPTRQDTAANGRARSLREHYSGELHLPGDAAYDRARLPWNVAVDQRAAAVAYPRSAAEVAQVVRGAASAGLRVAPQSTGHNAGPLAARGLGDAVLLRTGRLSQVSVDPRRRLARVGGGAVWLPAVEAAGAHGLAALHGSSPDVGVAGYSLGGGIGWYARALGLATNSLTAVELVTADGELVRADGAENPSLFWALRGGGGSFGVVTALEFRLYPIRTAYAGMLVWDVAHAERVLRRWAAWAPEAPDRVTTAFRVLRLPPAPEIPQPLRGRTVVIVDGAVLGGDATARADLAHLRALGPELDTFARVPAATLSRLHLDPEEGTPVESGSSMLTAFPDAAVEAFLAEVGPGADTSLGLAELRQLAGALGRPHPGGGALSHLDGDFVSFVAGVPDGPEAVARIREEAEALTGALAPWSNGRAYLNFTERLTDPRVAYDQAAWRRLTRIRAAADPGGLFLANHVVPGWAGEGASAA